MWSILPLAKLYHTWICAIREIVNHLWSLSISLFRKDNCIITVALRKCCNIYRRAKPNRRILSKRILRGYVFCFIHKFLIEKQNTGKLELLDQINFIFKTSIVHFLPNNLSYGCRVILHHNDLFLPLTTCGSSRQCCLDSPILLSYMCQVLLNALLLEYRTCTHRHFRRVWAT